MDLCGIKNKENICKRIAKKLVCAFKRIPVYFYVILALTAVCAIIELLCSKSVAVADWINYNVSSVFRFVLATISGIVPFSIAETLIISIPILLLFAIIYIIVLAVKCKKDKMKSLFFKLLSALLMMYVLFTLTLGIGYDASGVESIIGVEKKDVTATELFQTAKILAEKASECSKNVRYGSNGASVMPYSLSHLNDKLNDAYKSVSESYGGIRHFYSNVKPVALSKAMSYTHVTGVYTFFTGEANLNIAFPDYSAVYTQAHEMSHQRGFAKEDECNFMAFIVCTASDDEYIQYCGYVNLLEYVISALYKADERLYRELWWYINDDVTGEYLAYNSFYSDYQESTVSKVSTSINDGYLKSQGEEDGAKSYGRVVDLAVAYLLYGDN